MPKRKNFNFIFKINETYTSIKMVIDELFLMNHSFINVDINKLKFLVSVTGNRFSNYGIINTLHLI